MKLLIIGFAFAALACAQYAPSSEYLPPIQEVSQSLELDAPSNEYLAPEQPQTLLADDGYRYKTVRRQRIRRDVSELATQYLPPTQEVSVEVPSNEYLAPVVEEQQTVLADDGYRYKTVRRQRKRRDVSELATQYLPPTQEVSVEVPSNEYLAPVVEEQQTVLADDGYRYKTVHRQRKRRDVSELATQYLPPTQEVSVEVPSNEYLAPVVEEQQTVLADDGYRYKTVRRQRKRRDVSELATQYLPPTQEVSVEVPSNEYLAPVAEEQQTVLADDGYRYKTVRRQRKRRDVSELATQYLPPTQEVAVEVPSNEYLAPVIEEQQTVLADDGYRYKTVRRQRKRRDVSELSTQYLPPTQEVSVELPSNEYLAPVVEEQQTVLADDGYRYKTVRRIRKRRDVSELATQYLPPSQEVSVELPSNEYLAPVVEEQQTVLADDGYRYKTVRRQRKRRDVSELATQYLPPTQEVSVELPSNEYLAPVVEEQQNVLADDGYRYKTVRRQRKRRDVSELSTQYLPPTQEVSVELPSNEYLAPVVEEQQTVLADDGYRYKTVRRQRKRRDVSELATQYLPPTQEVSVELPSNEYLAPVVEEQQTVLADDGYRYKTVRRQRKRRDVSELSTQYLPPTQEVSVEIPAIPSNEYLAPAVELPQTVLADDGYRYKTVKKFKVHRH